MALSVTIRTPLIARKGDSQRYGRRQFILTGCICAYNAFGTMVYRIAQCSDEANRYYETGGHILSTVYLVRLGFNEESQRAVSQKYDRPDGLRTRIDALVKRYNRSCS